MMITELFSFFCHPFFCPPSTPMPITVKYPIRRMSQAEFGDLAYEVMRTVFSIRDELGRFFDEKIYKRELALRLPGVQLEVPIEVSHSTFTRPYFLDALVNAGAVFEFKAVEALTERHEASCCTTCCSPNSPTANSSICGRKPSSRSS